MVIQNPQPSTSSGIPRIRINQSIAEDIVRSNPRLQLELQKLASDGQIRIGNKFKCNYCHPNFLYSSKSHLERHMAQKHGGNEESQSRNVEQSNHESQERTSENNNVQTPTTREQSTQTCNTNSGQEIYENEENQAVAITEQEMLTQRLDNSETTDQGTQTEAESSNPLIMQDLEESLIISVNLVDLMAEENENLQQQNEVLLEVNRQRQRQDEIAGVWGDLQ